jgi:rhodanese-related sulfurtransferase
MIKHATVQQAHQRQQAGDPYVDVRSVPEFDQGHPAGSLNVPLLHLDRATRQLGPNADFVEVMRANFAPEAPLLVGCQAGVRSIQACEILAGAGFTNLTNVLGGFAGSWSGDIGWVQANLPIEVSSPEGCDYASLHGNVGRGGK